MHTHPAAIVGASGYTGLELTRLLARHPRIRLAALYSDRWSDDTAGNRLPLDGAAASLRYRALAEAERADAELVFLATPAEVSAELAPRLLAQGARVIDLSGAFRLEDAAAYPPWYGFSHPAPGLLAEARYGLPELAREKLAGARLVTNPGCYATAIALALAPLVKAGLGLEGGIAVTGLSGVSGAGRKASEDYSFVEIADDLRAYRLGKHQHVPEIEQTVARYAGACGPISFTPVLVPIRRGILATATVRVGRDRARVARRRARARRTRGAVRARARGRQGEREGRRAHEPLPRRARGGRARRRRRRGLGHRQPREGRRRPGGAGDERRPRLARDDRARPARRMNGA